MALGGKSESINKIDWCGYGESNPGIGSQVRRCYIPAIIGEFYNVGYNIPNVSGGFEGEGNHGGNVITGEVGEKW